MSTITVGAGGDYATIQEAINNATEGDTITVAAGTYNENLVVDVANLTIVASEGAVLQGTFKSDNGVAADGSVAEFLQSAVSYTGDSGYGVNVVASGVVIQGLAIDGFVRAVNFGADTTGGQMEDVTITDSVHGFYKTGDSNVDGLQIIGGSISDGYIGVYFEKVVDGTTDGAAVNVLIDGLNMFDLSDKGIYAETLSDSDILNLVADNVGYWGASPSFGGAHAGSAIELNFKSGAYSGVNIEGFAFTDVGTAAHNNSGAILIKVRDDGPSYSTFPATYTGAVTISDGSIDGTTTGIRAGEVGKTVAGPALIIDGVDITNALHDAFRGDIDNVTTSTLEITLTETANTLVAKAGGTGALNIHGAGGDDAITAAAGADSLEGGVGNDTLNGVSGLDTAVYAGSVSLTSGGGGWTAAAGDDGTDTLSNIDRVESSDGTTLLVGSGSDYDTIQEAIDAASAGDTIMIAEGTYAENLSITKALNFAGSGAVVIDGTGGNVITVSGDLAGGDLSFTGLSIAGESVGSGIVVNEGANIGTLTLDGVDMTDVGGWGLFVNGDDTGTAAAIVNVLNSSFDNVGYNGAGNGTGSTAAIKLFGFTGDATIQDVEIIGALVGAALAARPDYAVEFHGLPNASLNGLTAVPALGTVIIDGLDISGYFHKNPVALNNYANLAGLSVDGLDLSMAISDWGPLFNIDGITGSYDASVWDMLLPAGIRTELQGDVDGEIDTNQTITGTSFEDRMMGKTGDDALNGGDGADELFGADKAGGASEGDAGADTLNGGGGNDTLNGGAGVDTASYDGSATGVTVNLALGTSSGDTGSDTFISIENLLGSTQDDSLSGDAFVNRIDGGDGGDVLNGKAGVDTLLGGRGVDTLNGGRQADSIDGGAGLDIASYADASARVIVNLDTQTAKGADGADTLASIEGAIGSAFDDALTGADGANRLYGGDGADVIRGLGGVDQIEGGDGADQIDGGGAADRLYGGTGADTFMFREAIDLEGGGDRIFDLEAGDTVNLKGIDAREDVGGNQQFKLVAAFTGVSGQATLKYNAGQDITFLRMDTDGDKVADLTLRMDGDHTGFGGFVL